jgi:predicted patatin/cPLA2 family phospholipase
VTLSNPQTQEDNYVCLDSSDKIIQTLLTACSMPLLSGSRGIGNTDYFDGGLTAQTPIKKAFEFEPAEIWIISVNPKGYRVNGVFWKTISLFEIFNAGARKLLYNYPARQNRIIEQMEANSSLKIIRPKSALPIGFRSTNKLLIKQVFALGEEAAKSFLSFNGHAN